MIKYYSFHIYIFYCHGFRNSSWNRDSLSSTDKRPVSNPPNSICPDLQTLITVIYHMFCITSNYKFYWNEINITQTGFMLQNLGPSECLIELVFWILGYFILSRLPFKILRSSFQRLANYRFQCSRIPTIISSCFRLLTEEIA